MRESCLDCARKHIAQAEILMLEYATGDYPVHKWYAVGHLAEAADEMMEKYPSVAETLRTERLKYMEDDAYQINTAELISLVSSFDEQAVQNELEDMAYLMGEAEQYQQETQHEA